MTSAVHCSGTIADSGASVTGSFQDSTAWSFVATNEGDYISVNVDDVPVLGITT